MPLPPRWYQVRALCSLTVKPIHDADIGMITVLDRHFCLARIFPLRMYVNPGTLSGHRMEPSFAN